MPYQDRLGCRTCEGRGAGDHLVQDAAKRVDIATAVELSFASDLLGAHVGRTAEYEAGIGQGGSSCGFGDCTRDTEIRDQPMPVLHQNVVRLDVAMHDAAPVRVVQRAGHADRQPQRRGHRQSGIAQQTHAERFTFDKRHRVVRDAPRFAGAQQRNDVRMHEGRGNLNFTSESFDADRDRHLSRQHLDDDSASERDILRHEHAAHRAAAKLALDDVIAPERLLELITCLIDGVLLCHSRSPL